MNLIERELQLSQQTVNLLQQEQLVVKKEIKAQKVLTYSLVIALIIALLSSYFIYRSGLQKRKANQLLALKSLRSQMNPHFIYNSLNSVNNYISKNDERAANKYLSSFSRLMRAVMDNSKHDFVPLNSEIDILNIYLSLEHSRFEEKFDYRFEVDDSVNTDSYLVPPMLIQPFIENAIWHGLRYLETKGFLKVAIQDKHPHIEIRIEDNGIGRKKSSALKTKHQKTHNSTGMQNIENRIDIIKDLYQINIAVSVEDIDDNGDTGTRVIIHLPKKEHNS
jgi:LytS/YehU family sensor histidine kinase